MSPTNMTQGGYNLNGQEAHCQEVSKKAEGGWAMKNPRILCERRIWGSQER
jgi:hypothetical protein